MCVTWHCVPTPRCMVSVATLTRSCHGCKGFPETKCIKGCSKHAGYLEPSDQLDDPCNSQQSQQLLNAQQLTGLQSQHSWRHPEDVAEQALPAFPKLGMNLLSHTHTHPQTSVQSELHCTRLMNLIHNLASAPSAYAYAVVHAFIHPLYQSCPPVPH